MTRVGQEEEVAVAITNIKADFRLRLMRYGVIEPFLRYVHGYDMSKELTGFILWHFNRLNHMRQEYLETQSQS